MSWEVIKDPGSSYVQIIPLHDLAIHVESLECLCDPQVKIVEDGSRDLLVHNVLWDTEDEALACAN